MRWTNRFSAFDYTRILSPVSYTCRTRETIRTHYMCDGLSRVSERFTNIILFIDYFPQTVSKPPMPTNKVLSFVHAPSVKWIYAHLSLIIAIFISGEKFVLFSSFFKIFLYLSAYPIPHRNRNRITYLSISITICAKKMKPIRKTLKPGILSYCIWSNNVSIFN